MVSSTAVWHIQLQSFCEFKTAHTVKKKREKLKLFIFKKKCSMNVNEANIYC